MRLSGPRFIFCGGAILVASSLAACGGGGGSAKSTAPATTEVSLSLTAPANNTLVAVDTAQPVTASVSNITADQLSWTVLPAGMASNVTLEPAVSIGSGVTMNFTATVPGDYTVRVTANTDTTKTAQVDLRVHEEYLAIDSFHQRRVILRADGRVVGTTLSDGADQEDAPTDELKAVSQGLRFRLGIRLDGSVVLWGDGSNNGTTISTGSPPSGLVAKHVAAGSYHSIAIGEDGTLAVWGRINGKDTELPDELETGTFIDADVSNGDFAAIREDGTLVVWSADSGQLNTLPADWQGKTFTQVCSTMWHVVALDSTGVVWAWNPVNGLEPALDTPPAATGPVTAVFCGSDQAAYVQQDGRVRTWGVIEGTASEPLFDSSTVSGFPRVKGVSLFQYRSTYFLTESGAIIDTSGNVVTAIDSL